MFRGWGATIINQLGAFPAGMCMSDAGARDRIKMPIGQLSIGMYVVELDRPWGETAFLFQGFRIRQQQEILLLAEVCQYVWVDARRSVGMQRQVEEISRQRPLPSCNR